MADITVHRHGDRWAVREASAESPVKEFPTREAADLAASQMADGGTVEMLEDGAEPTITAGDPLERSRRQPTGL